MIQGASEPDGSSWGWGWDGDGDDDWDSAVLTLLALAVVAATALALHWFGSGQDQETAGPASTGPRAQPSQTRGAGPALPPKAKVSGGVEGRNSGPGRPDPPGLSQGSPAAAGIGDHQPPGSGDLTATAAPPLKTAGVVASAGALGQQHGNSTPEVPRGEAKEHLSPGAALLGGSKVAGTPAPLLIHFTPRSPDSEVEVQAEAGGVRAMAPAHQAPAHTVGQDTSSWKHGVGPSRSTGRGTGSRRWQVGDSSGDRTCRSPKLDPLRLGAVVSVWDAVDAASSLSAGAQRPRYPQELPPPDSVQTGRLTDGSETGSGKSGPQPAPVLALDSGAKAGESSEVGPWTPREFQGSPPSVEGWPWARREVLVTRSFNQASGSMGPLPEEQQWERPLLSQGQGTTVASIVGKAGASGGHSFFSSGPSRTEKQGAHSAGKGGASQRGQGLPSRGQGTGGLDTGKPATDSLSCGPCPSPSATTPLHTSKPTLPSANPTEAHPHRDLLPADPASGSSPAPAATLAPATAPATTLAPASASAPAPALAASSISTPAPVLTAPPASNTSSAPAAALTPAPAPAAASAPTSAPAAAPAPTSAPAPAAASAATSAPAAAPDATLAPAAAPAAASAPTSAPAPAAASAPTSAPAAAPAASSAPTSAPAAAPAASSAPTSAPTTAPAAAPAATSAPAAAPAAASAPTSAPVPAPAPAAGSAPTSAPAAAPAASSAPTSAPTTAPAAAPAATSAPAAAPAAASAPTSAPAPAPAAASAPTSAPAPAPAAASAPTSAPAAAPAATSAPAAAPAAASAPTSAPAPAPAPAAASAPTSAPAPAATSAPAPAAASAPTSAPAPAAAPAPALAPVVDTPPAVAPVPAAASPPPVAQVPGATPAPAPAPSPAPAATPGPSSKSRPAFQEPSVATGKGNKEAQISTSWGNLISMVLRSHPFPRQEKLQGTAQRAALESSREISTPTASENRESGSPSERATLGLKDRQGSPAEMVTGGLAEARSQPQQSSSEMNETAVPRAPSQQPEKMKPGPEPSPTARGDPQPVPRPRKRSMCEVEMAESSERKVSQAAPGEVPGERPSPVSSRGALTEKQKEARKLMVFLQKPGSWGVVEGPRKPSSLAREAALAAALQRRLDLGSCLDVLAFAQRHGKTGLAQETYALMSDNLLHVLGDPNLYRQLSGTDRERILSLRTGRGQAVLGVLVLPSLYQVSRSGLTRGPHMEEPPATGPAPLPPPSRLHMFNPQENTWQLLTQVPEEVPLRGCGLCTMYNYLFLAGGIRGSGTKAVCSNEVFCYNPLTNIWSQVRPMQQARAQLKLVALDGLLYAIGGECLYSMECYDPRTDTWTSRAPLPAGTFPVAHEAVACRGDIYVTGGHLFYRLLRYSPAKDAWDECPYSASHRRSSDMVALGGFLYRFDLLRGVGAAVMRYNTVTGSWSRAAPLPLPDPVPLRCTVLGNTIYCLNHQVTATFTVSEGTAQFQAKELQPFPLGSKGVLCPFILTLPPADPLQTAL